jgi:integrase
LVKASSQTLAPATVEGVYKTVKAVFRSAVTDRVIAVSPCVDVTLPRKPRKRVVPLTTDQVLSIAEFVPGRYRGLIVFMAGTGLRPSEAFGVTVDRVEFLRHQVTVDRQLSGTAPTFGQPKTEASYRDVPLPDIVLEGLSAHISAHGLGAEGLLFTNTKGQPIDRRRFGEIWRRAAKKVQVASTPHDARHYYASLLIRYGESVKTVQARLGHSTAGETLNTYGHLWPDSDDRTRAAVDEMLGVGASISRQSLGVSDVEAGQGSG